MSPLSQFFRRVGFPDKGLRYTLPVRPEPRTLIATTKRQANVERKAKKAKRRNVNRLKRNVSVRQYYAQVKGA